MKAGILLAAWLVLAAGAAPAQTPTDAYASLWREAAAALVGFSRVGTEPGAPADLAARAAAWRRERDRFEAALVQLIRTSPPADLTPLHWKLVPLHEELLAALSTVVEGAARGDHAAVTVGWTWVRQAHAALQRVSAEARAPR